MPSSGTHYQRRTDKREKTSGANMKIGGESEGEVLEAGGRPN